MEMVQWVVSGVRQQRWTAVSGQVTDTVCAQVSSFFKTEDDNDAASGGDTLLKGFLGRKKELPHVQPSEQCITHGRQHMNQYGCIQYGDSDGCNLIYPKRQNLP